MILILFLFFATISPAQTQHIYAIETQQLPVVIQKYTEPSVCYTITERDYTQHIICTPRYVLVFSNGRSLYVDLKSYNKQVVGHTYKK